MSANTSSERNVSIPPATVEAMRDEPEHAVLPSAFADHEPEIWAVASELDTMDGSSPTKKASVRDRFDAPAASRAPPPSPSIESVSSQYSSSPISSEQRFAFGNDRDCTARSPQRSQSSTPWFRDTSPIRFPSRSHVRPERAAIPPEQTPSPGTEFQAPMYQTMRYSPRSGYWRIERHGKIESEAQRYRLHPTETASRSEIARNVEEEELSAYADERSPRGVVNSIPRVFSVTLIHTRPDGYAQSVRCIGLRDNVAAAFKLVEDMANDPSLHGRTIQVTVQGEDSRWQDPYDGCVINTSPGVVQVMIEPVRNILDSTT
ncbi:hypothetical protein AC578_8951 [Pseudocercospora eumusae]|uniref:Uncharacterized protein n=1 Tax=Pseudocercospora eumusae TaxID=321146 RepID=A0A139HN04_9PEZI|nr:hypothetical protein AC578_8951 [Pseudocercospora eumusae]